MNGSNCKLYTVVILNVFLSIECRRNQEKSPDNEISIEVHGESYKIYSMKKSWLEAVLECEDRDSVMPEINSIEAKALARAMLKHRPAIESVWIAGLEESIPGLPKEEIEKISSPRENLECLFLDCHLDGMAILKSCCNRRRHVACQNKNRLLKSEISSSTVGIYFSSTLPSNQEEKVENSTHKNSSDKILSPVKTMRFLPKIEEFISSSTKLPVLRIKSMTENFLKVNRLQEKKLTTSEPRIEFVAENLPEINEFKEDDSKKNPLFVRKMNYFDVPKLYYTFEGPLVGKLDENVNNNNNSLISKRKLTHKYQKYLPTRA